MQFTDFSLDKNILSALKELRFKTPTAIQTKAIPLILAKKNVIMSAQTGTGKTAAFALPIASNLHQNKDNSTTKETIKILVLSPTRELALQILEQFNSIIKHTNLSATAVYGGVSLTPQKEQLAKGVDILVATPGRLIDLHLQEALSLKSITTFVLDEADLMLDMGFIKDVKRIEQLCPPKKQHILCSATIPENLLSLAKNAVHVNSHPTDNNAVNIGQLLYYLAKKIKPIYAYTY
jgi:Superfamily II DNA and RNA helicases